MIRLLLCLSCENATILFNIFPLPQTQGFSRSLAYMGRFVDGGTNILLFPEGEHSLDGKMLPFQPGLGTMVRELGIPVIPVYINGAFQILPHDADLTKRGRVTVTFGKPLYLRNEELAEKVELLRNAW